MSMQTRYLALSFASGAFEIGIVVGAIGAAWPVTTVLATGLAYQLGAVFVDASMELGTVWRRAALVAAATAVMAVPAEPIVFVAAAFATGLVLHQMRGDAPKGTTTLVKRGVRVAGFIIGAGAGIYVVPIAAAAILGVDIAARAPVAAARSIPPLRMTAPHLVMVVHQSHYFTYAYALVMLLVADLGVPSALAGMIFSIGWVSYLLAERVLAALPASVTVVAGHLLTAACLVTIGTRHESLPFVLTAWFLSGFGGGSVFRLGQWVAASSSPAETHRWENIGHVVGVVTAGVIVTLTGQLMAAFYAGALLAVSTAIGYSMLAARRPTTQCGAGGTFAT